MAPEGIWSNEILGLFGWESTGILILEGGRAVDGGNHHFSIGTYESSDGQITISLKVEYHGTPRTMFGSADRNLSVRINGKLSADTIEGQAYRLDKPDQKISVKLTRRADLPPRARP